MIAPDVHFDHLDPEEWRRLRGLLRPGGGPLAGGGGLAGRARGGRVAPVILLVEGGRTVAALRPDLAGGPPAVEDPARHPYRGPASLPALRRAASARFAAAVEVAALARIGERYDARLVATDPPLVQGVKLAQVVRAELGRGIVVDPDPFSALPVPSVAALQQTVDLLLPDDRSAGLFLFEAVAGRSRLVASIAVVKRRGQIVRVTSARALGPVPDDFQNGLHRAVLDAMARRLERPHAAIFMSVGALRDTLGPQPGAFAQAVALRQVVIDPAPPWLVALAGAGAVAGVAQTAHRLFGRFVPQSVKDTARDAARTFSPFSPLGFDPIQLFSELSKLF